jgi:hypothetical protein
LQVRQDVQQHEDDDGRFDEAYEEEVHKKGARGQGPGASLGGCRMFLQ